MGQQDSGVTVSREYLEFLLRSARRAGTFLIVPHGADADAVNMLTCQGYVRRHLGHIVLTLKGQEHLRHASRVAALSA